MTESFNFLIKQNYPSTEVVASLRDYLIGRFRLNNNGDGRLAEAVAAQAYFRFTYVEQCLLVDRSIKAERGKEKAISFKVKVGLDIDKLVERALNIMPAIQDSSAYSCSIN